MTEFQEALKLSPQDATLHYNLGLAFKSKDKLPEALAEFRKAEEIDPSQPDAHYTQGVTLWQQGDFVAAAEELRAAIRAKPNYRTRNLERTFSPDQEIIVKSALKE